MKDIRDIYQEIAEQRAELMYCILSAEERRETQARLDAALRMQYIREEEGA